MKIKMRENEIDPALQSPDEIEDGTDKGKSEPGNDITASDPTVTTDIGDYISNLLISNEGVLYGPGAMNGSGVEKLTSQLYCTPLQREMPPEMLQMIASAMESGIEDLTDVMDNTYDMTSGGTVIWSKAESEIDTDFDEKLARQLVWIKDWKNTIGHQTYRQEPRGKLDGTRLYRAAIDQKVFKTRAMIDRGELDLVMLCDASSSMRDKMSIYKDARPYIEPYPMQP